jgi:hypothetical protein
MSQPIVVTIPHQLGKAEALTRLQRGFSDAGSNPGGKFFVFKNRWAGEHLDFQASLLGQTGSVDVRGGYSAA